MAEELSKNEIFKKISESLNNRVIVYGQDKYPTYFKKRQNNDHENARGLYDFYLSQKEKDELKLTDSFLKDYLPKFLGNGNSKGGKKLLKAVKIIFEKYNTKLTKESKGQYEAIDITIVENAIKMYEKNTEPEKEEIKASGLNSLLRESLNLFFNEKSCPTFLEGSEWYFFERVGIKNPFKHLANSQGKTEWGVTISELKFESSKSYFVPVNFKRNYYTDGLIEYEGITTKDSHNVYVDLINGNNRLHIALRLDEDNPQIQKIFVGHFTFYAKDFGNRTITKIILMVNKDILFRETEGKEINLPNIELGKISYDSETFSKLPEKLRYFLSGREHVMIYTPELSVHSPDSLKEFLKHHKEENVNPVIKKFAGDYYAYYQSSDLTIIQDKFSIKHSPFYNAFEVNYEHDVASYEHDVTRWFGKPYYNMEKKCVILELSNNYPKKKEKINDEDPILLTFQMPKGKKNNNLKAIECFPAVISGLEDDDYQTTQGGISLLCLVVRHSVVHSGIEDERIKKFFSDNKENSRLKLEEKHLKFRLDEI